MTTNQLQQVELPIEGYDFVNERLVNGVLYRAWRWRDDPKRCLVEAGEQVIAVDNLKKFWKELV